MNTQRTRNAAKLSLTALALAASSLAVLSPSTATSAAAHRRTHMPAAGATVICQGVGKLTGTGGHLVAHEPTWHDGHGRAHVLFSIVARKVRLTDGDGTHYRLVGGGYDSVAYRGRDVTGQVSKEDEALTFDVTGPDGVVGVVRFRLRSAHGHSPSIHDASTCKLPHLS